MIVESIEGCMYYHLAYIQISGDDIEMYEVSYPNSELSLVTYYDLHSFTIESHALRFERRVCLHMLHHIPKFLKFIFCG